MRSEELPVVVVGAGPVGLAAVAHLAERRIESLALETGRQAAAHVSDWAHVRMFSPWKFNVERVAERWLARSGWVRPPEDELPTGGELVERYLAPLARAPEIARSIRFGCRVTAISKHGYDRVRSAGRESAAWVVRYEEGGAERTLLARAVLDASGTWASPNPIGAGGELALGERTAHDRILSGAPDVLGRHRDRVAGRHVLVVGGGDSAFNALIDLTRLAEQDPATRITWAVRSSAPRFGGGAADQLPARGALGVRVRQLLAGNRLRLVTKFQVEEIVERGGTLEARGFGRSVKGVDVIVAATGFRPDHSLASEIRLDLDPTTESPVALGPLIDPNLHSCGTVPPHGIDELTHPDFGYFTVGIKSYGRAPTFLLATGYEQVRSVVAGLAGDWAAAREVQLELPETGVCGTTPNVTCCEPGATESTRWGATTDLTAGVAASLRTS